MAELLTRYDVDVAHYRLAVRSFNTVYRVTATDGRRYALRLGPPDRLHRPDAEAAEAALMSRAASVGVPVPHVVRTTTGSVRAQADGRTAVLFGWMPGARGRGRLTSGRRQELGRLLALMHGAACDGPYDVFVADRVLYFDLPDRLGSTAYGSLFPDARDAAQQVLDELWRQPPHAPALMHGDVQPNNLLVSGPRVTVIDFQDVMRGFDVQDLAITTADLRREPDGDAQVAELRRGYESVRPWPDVPDHVLLALEAARWLNVFNLTISRAPDRPPGYFDRHAETQRAFLRVFSEGVGE